MEPLYNSYLPITATFLISQSAILLYKEPLFNSYLPITATFLISQSAILLYKEPLYNSYLPIKATFLISQSAILLYMEPLYNTHPTTATFCVHKCSYYKRVCTVWLKSKAVCDIFRLQITRRQESTP